MNQVLFGLLTVICLVAAFTGGARAQDETCKITPDVCACSSLPACPDGTTSIGFPGFCGCQRPDDCPVLTHFWQCKFFAQGDSFNPGGWECSCDFVGPPDPPRDPTPPPFDPPPGFCEFAGAVCADGSTPIQIGLECVCRQ